MNADAQRPSDHTPPDGVPQASAEPTPAPANTWRYTIGLALALVAVAAWALPRSIQAGDAGEFATVMLRGGLPHPSGYPWMRVLGLVARFVHWTGVPPATAAALPCAAAAIAGFLVLHRVSLQLARPADGVADRTAAVSATFATALVAVSAIVVLHAFDSEVWGPLILAAALLVWFSTRPNPRPLWMGLAFGLCMSHHLTLVFCLPLVVASVWPRPFSLRALARTGGLGAFGGVMGLCMFATLAIGGPGGWQWGDPDSWSGLIHHVSRSDYGVLSLSLHTERPSLWSLIARALSSIGRVLTAGLAPHPLAGAAAMLGIIGLAWRPEAAMTLRTRIGLAGAVIASSVGFAATQNIAPDSPFGAWILERFDILPVVLMIPFVAAAAANSSRRLEGRGRVGTGLALGVALLVLRQLVFTAWNGVPSGNPHIEAYARDVLATPTPNVRAVIIGTDDHRTFPLLYAQEVLGLGGSVTYVDASLLAHPWYRARIRSRMPDFPDVDKPVRLLNAITADPKFADVELYLSNDFSVQSGRIPKAPKGVLWQVLRPDAEPPSLDEAVARHDEAVARYGPGNTGVLVSGHPFAIDLLTAYTEGSKKLAMALDAAGRGPEADALLVRVLDRGAPPPRE